MLDTGATRHFLADPSLLTHSRPVRKPIRVANGAVTHSTADGSATLTIDGKPIVLPNAASVPSFTESLLSGVQLHNSGHRIVIDRQEGSHVLFRIDGGKTVRVDLITKDNTFFLPMNATSSSFQSDLARLTADVARLSVEDNLLLLHARLGDVAYPTLLAMLRHNSVDGAGDCGKTVPPNCCPVCLASKSRMHSRSSAPRDRTVDPGSVLHSDLFGPVVVDNLKHWVNVVVDEASRYLFLRVLLSKRSVGVLDHFKEILSDISARGYVCHRIHTDYEATVPTQHGDPRLDETTRHSTDALG